MSNAINYYKTADGQVFYTENLANNHARTLTSKEVEVISKDDYEKGSKPAKVKESASATDYLELKARAKELGINPNQKKEILEKLITEAQKGSED